MKLSQLIKANYDPKQLSMGTAVEKEHKRTVEHLKANPNTLSEKAFQMIAEDHLNELDNYYTLLVRMEKAAEGKVDEKYQRLLKFFKANPYPDDNQIHGLAETLNVDEKELEKDIYGLLSWLLGL